MKTFKHVRVITSSKLHEHLNHFSNCFVDFNIVSICEPETNCFDIIFSYDDLRLPSKDEF